MAKTGRELTDAARQAVPKLSNDRLQEQIKTGAPPVILDVREPEEWNEGHLEQATFLPRGRLEGRVEEMVPDRNTPIVVH